MSATLLVDGYTVDRVTRPVNGDRERELARLDDARRRRLSPAPAPAPARSLAQRMEALERANKVRTYRKELKRDLAAGRVTIDELLLEPVPEMLETAKVFDLLLAVPKIGRVKANKVLLRARVSPSKTVGGLSPRQRAELVSLLRFPISTV